MTVGWETVWLMTKCSICLGSGFDILVMSARVEAAGGHPQAVQPQDGAAEGQEQPDGRGHRPQEGSRARAQGRLRQRSSTARPRSPAIHKGSRLGSGR